MTGRLARGRMWRLTPWAVVALAVVVWLLPLQSGWYVDQAITDIPTYQGVARHISAGDVPYRDFALEYPPLAAGLFWLADVLPGSYAEAFSRLMLLCLIATALGVMALARALGFGRGRTALAGGAVALSPLLIGDLVETRFDLALAAALAWTLWAAASGRHRLAWTLLGLATLLKLVPIVLAPVLAIWQAHRERLARALRGAAGCAGVVAAGLAPFAVLSPSGTWDLARYHLDRPLQIESLGSAYLMVLHEIAGVGVVVESSFGSQGLAGGGARAIAAISTALLVATVAAVALTLHLLIHRARPPGDARLMLAASAATVGAVLAAGKVLSPQFLVWLLPVGFLVAGRYGPAAFGGTVVAMALTLAYFPHRYWDLVALETGPVALLAARDAVLVALVAAFWPRPALAMRAEGRTIGRPLDARAERAVSARYLTD